MPTAVEAYQLSADGHTDQEVAQSLGLTLWRVRTILRSPRYGGRLPDGRETRFTAPVPLHLREASARHRSRRSTSGHSSRHHVYPLPNGPLGCDLCERPIKGIYRNESMRRMYRH